MTTTVLETNATHAVPHAASAMQDISLACIRESKTNPRCQFEETKLAELADYVPGNIMSTKSGCAVSRSPLSCARCRTALPFRQ
jgi:hypothetical protein